MDYFNDADRVNYIAVYGRAREHQKYLKLCSEDEQSFYGLGTTWG